MSHIEKQFLQLACDEFKDKNPRWAREEFGTIARALDIALHRDITRVGPEQYDVAAQRTKGAIYRVDRNVGTCTCPDFEKRCADPNRRKGCKHRIAVYFWRRAQELRAEFALEFDRWQASCSSERWEEQFIEFTTRDCSGHERPVRQRLTAEQARNILSLHSSNAAAGIQGAERWYWSIPEVSAEVALCQSVIAADKGVKPKANGRTAKEPAQRLMFTSGEDLPLFSGTAPRASAETFDPKPESKQLGFFNCPACRDTGTVHLQNGRTVRCWCSASPREYQQLMHDKDGPLYFEAEDEREKYG